MSLPSKASYVPGRIGRPQPGRLRVNDRCPEGSRRRPRARADTWTQFGKTAITLDKGMREDGVGDTVRAEFRPNHMGRYKPDWDGYDAIA